MNVKKALKEKAKLIKKIGESFSRIEAYNSVEEGTIRPYDPRVSLAQWLADVDKLIVLKAEIHKANTKVLDKIFRLSELKNIIKQIKSIDCSEGKSFSGYGRSEASIKNSLISVVERDELVKKYETEIEDLQEILDAHNLKTLVKVV